AERRRRPCAVRVPLLPRVPELRDGSLLARRDEDRVVAEPLGAARLLGDPAVERPGAAMRLPLRGDRDQLADVARLAVGPARARPEQPPDRVVWPPSRLDSRTPTERGPLDPRVLAQHPVFGRPDLAAVARLRPRVLLVGRAALRGEVICLQEADRPARKRRL